MTKETTNRQVQELYPESDAATKRDLEGLANSISHFRAAVLRVAERQAQLPIGLQLEKAAQRRRSTQRRVMLEWAVALALCVAALVPATSYYRTHAAQQEAQRQAQLLKQHEADAALLEQVTSELSESVPDSLQPLADMDTDYASYQTPIRKTEKTNANN
jgi:hypothetical protein